MPFFAIFIIIPFIELFLFATVSEHIGIWTTLSLAFLTAIIGGGLVKHQGLQTLFSMRKNAESGQMPLNEIFDGFCIVAAGALLITPGFLTDFIGFSLLVPQARKILRDIIRQHTSWSATTHSAHSHYRPQDSSVIEGEFEHLDPHDKSE